MRTFKVNARFENGDKTVYMTKALDGFHAMNKARIALKHIGKVVSMNSSKVVA